MFQSFNLLPRMSALHNVELPLVYAGVRPKNAGPAAQALESVGLGARMDHFPSELSGGQQQRAAVARAIVTDPALILADEPTGNLDTESSLDVMSVFDALHSQGRTVVLITHEEDIAAYTAGGQIPRRRYRRRLPPGPGRGARGPRAHARASGPEPPGEVARCGAGMALGGVSPNKLRSALTMLGVLIGVSAVIILVAVGTGSSRAVEARIDALGTNTLTVINTGRSAGVLRREPSPRPPP